MDLEDSTGGKVQYFPFVHTFVQLVPAEENFEKHPEYYSLIDGERRSGAHSQLCLEQSRHSARGGGDRAQVDRHASRGDHLFGLAK